MLGPSTGVRIVPFTAASLPSSLHASLSSTLELDQYSKLLAFLYSSSILAHSRQRLLVVIILQVACRASVYFGLLIILPFTTLAVFLVMTKGAKALYSFLLG